MAQITINESSSNYSYNTSDSSFCSVALPITASWGPAFENPSAVGVSLDEEIEKTAFIHFPATQAGLASFMSTYRGPAAGYRSAKDYSYNVALSLLTAGYDVDVCRLCPGSHSQASFTDGAEEDPVTVAVTAKYPGSFGNNIKVSLVKVTNKNYWNMIVYIVDANGSKTAVENIVFVFDIDNSTDSILHISEVESKFVDVVPAAGVDDDTEFTATEVTLAGGSDRAADGTVSAMITDASSLLNARFGLVSASDKTSYAAAVTALSTTADVATASKVRYMEWIYRYTMEVLNILKDKLAYSPNRIILPGWDDQNIAELTGEDTATITAISPLHARLLEVAEASRCAVAYIDIPKCLARSAVHSTSSSAPGYAQILSNYCTTAIGNALAATHSALYAPWGNYTFAGTSKQAPASPSFLALVIQRAMIRNQSLQYEWAMPTTRKHNVNVGKLDYTVPKRLLDEWQSDEGVSLNVIADIPDMGVSAWGNSTLMNVPPATYNPLQNLSTRLIMNAVANVAYKCGLGITFQYNNSEAYSKFYAGVTPILDLMHNVGAVQKYEVSMSADIDALDSVSTNKVLGKVTIWLYGVINAITIDLKAMPTDNE